MTLFALGQAVEVGEVQRVDITLGHSVQDGIPSHRESIRATAQFLGAFRTTCGIPMVTPDDPAPEPVMTEGQEESRRDNDRQQEESHQQPGPNQRKQHDQGQRDMLALRTVTAQ